MHKEFVCQNCGASRHFTQDVLSVKVFCSCSPQVVTFLRAYPWLKGA